MDWKRNEANVLPMPEGKTPADVARVDLFGTLTRGERPISRRMLGFVAKDEEGATVTENAKGEQVTEVTITRVLTGGAAFVDGGISIPAMDGGWPAADWTGVRAVITLVDGATVEAGAFACP